MRNFILISILVFSLESNAALFGPDNYDECILENVKPGISNEGVKAIRRVCRNKFPSKHPKSNRNLYSPSPRFTPSQKRCADVQLTTKEYNNLKLQQPSRYSTTLWNGNNFDVFNITVEFSVRNSSSPIYSDLKKTSPPQKRFLKNTSSTLYSIPSNAISYRFMKAYKDDCSKGKYSWEK